MLISNESNGNRLDDTESVREEEEMAVLGDLYWKSVSEREGSVESEMLSFLSVSLIMAVVVDWSCDWCRSFCCVAPPTFPRPAARSHTLAMIFTQLYIILAGEVRRAYVEDTLWECACVCVRVHMCVCMHV